MCARVHARSLARDKMKNKNKSVSKNKSSKEFHGECRMCMCLHNHRKPYAMNNVSETFGKRYSVVVESKFLIFSNTLTVRY